MFDNEKKSKNKTEAGQQAPEVGTATLPGEGQQAQSPEEYKQTLTDSGLNPDADFGADDFEEITGGEFLKGSSMTEGKPVVYKFLKRDTSFNESSQKESPVVLLEDENKRTFKAAQAVIVEHLANVEEGKTIRLTYLGKKKGAKYTYDNFKIEVAKSK